MAVKYQDIKYGDSWERFPVQRGDLWAVGASRFMCGDAESTDFVRFGQQLPTFDLVYVDPPWGAGNATGFRKKASMDGKAQYDQLLARLASLVSHCQGDVFIEMGVRWADKLDQAMAAAGATRRFRWNITYYRKHPCTLSRYTFQGDRGFPLNLNGADDMETPYLALGAYPSGKIVVDPMCGQGLTALAAHESGHQFHGFELHPRRMAVALERLATASGETPTRLSPLSH